MFNKLANFRKDKKGFTLVEIIVVLVILAILAAIAIPTMMGFINQANDQALISQARTAYVAAQTEATKAAGAAVAAGKTSVTYATATALTGAGTWAAKINPYLDADAANIGVMLAGDAGVKAGTVAAVVFQKVDGGRAVAIRLDYEGAPTGWTAGTEAFDTVALATGSITGWNVTTTQTITGSEVAGSAS